MFSRYVDGLDKRLMKKKGFKYCKEFDKFVLDGFGVYFTDVDKEQVEFNFNTLEKLGYVMVTGPAIGSNFTANVGLYCRNYIDVLCDREMLKEDVDSLVKRIIVVSRLKDEVGDSSLYLEKFIIDEIVRVQDVTLSLDLDDFYKVICDLNNICNGANKVRDITLKEMHLGLTQYFYERVVPVLDKDVDKEKVSGLVDEAKCLAYDLQLTRRYPFLEVWDPSTIEDTAREITGFVERVKTENTTSEIRGLLNGLKVSDNDYLEGTEYMVAILDGFVKNKTIDEYSSEVKAKIKEKK